VLGSVDLVAPMVRCVVDLDYQFRFERDKVDNPNTDWDLSPEPSSGGLVLDATPKAGFGNSQLIAKHSRTSRSESSMPRAVHAVSMCDRNAH
jgi:hypothetical protein